MNKVLNAPPESSCSLNKYFLYIDFFYSFNETGATLQLHLNYIMHFP